jgi:RHS repeat-associated protein
VTKYYYHGGKRVAMRSGGQVYYLHGDHLGSTSLTTDENGEVVSRQLYHPFGTVRYSEGANPTNFGFTGQRHDGTGLVFMRARYYHAALGRFVSGDAVVPEPKNPQDWNRYAYVANNPIRSTDPSGHFIINRPSWMYMVPGLNAIAYAKDCATSISQAVEAYNAGERRVGVLALHATGATDYLFRQAGEVAALNEDVSVVFSGAPLEERLPHAIHLGIWATGTAATIVGAAQLAKAGIGALRSGASQVADDVVGQVADDASGALRPGEAGRFGDLDARAIVGDDLTPHHMPQRALGWTSADDGGALMMRTAEHTQTRTYWWRGAQTAAQDTGRPFRDVLAADIWDVRSIVGSRYNEGLQALINYYRTNFPNLMAK